MSVFQELVVKFSADKRGYDRAASDVDRSLKGIARGAKAAGVAIAAAIGVQGVRAMGEFVRAGGQAANIQLAFARATRGQVGALRQLQAASGGTISNLELMTQANQALALGAAKNASEVAELVRVSRSLGRALGIDATFALNSLNTGIARQSKLYLDNLGIIIDVEAANERYAASIGKTVQQLTDAERREVFRNTALERANELVAELGGVTETSADSMERLAVAFQNTVDGIKMMVARAPELRMMFELMGGVLGRYNESIDARSMGLSVSQMRDLEMLTGMIPSLNLQQTQQLIGQTTIGLGSLGPVDPTRAVMSRYLAALEAHEQELRRAAQSTAEIVRIQNAQIRSMPAGAGGMAGTRPTAPPIDSLFGGGGALGPSFMDNVGEMFRSTFDPKNLGMGLAQGIASGGVSFLMSGLTTVFQGLFGGMSSLERAIRDNTRILDLVSSQRFAEELTNAGFGDAAVSMRDELRRLLEEIALGNVPFQNGVARLLNRQILEQSGFDVNMAEQIAAALGIDLENFASLDALRQFLTALERGTGALDGLGDAARSVTGALLNVPTGFKVALNRFRADGAGGGDMGGGGVIPGGEIIVDTAPPPGGGGGGRGTGIYVDKLYIQAATPTVARQLETEILRSSGRGTTLLQPAVR